MSATQPYYLELPESTRGSLVEQQACWLCDGLRRMGLEAYILGDAAVAPGVNASSISLSVMLAHYRGGRRPIRVVFNSQNNPAETPKPGAEFNVSLDHQSPQLELQVSCMAWRKTGVDDETSTGTPILAADAFPMVVLPFVEPADWFASDPDGLASGSRAAVYTGLADEPRMLVPDEMSALPRVGFGSDCPITDIRGLLDQVRGFDRIYCFRADVQSLLFRLFGRQVVYVPNDLLLAKPPEGAIHRAGSLCVGRIDSWNAPDRADLVRLIQQIWSRRFEGLDAFIAASQTWASSLGEADCWPHEARAVLLPPGVYPAEAAASSDAAVYARLARQTPDWLTRMQPAESDADRFAHIETRLAAKPWGVVLVDAGGDLAKTLDSLEQSWSAPQWILIHAQRACPLEKEALGAGVIWWDRSYVEPSDLDAVQALLGGVAQVLVAVAGSSLLPFAALEFRALMAQRSTANIIFSDALVEVGGIGRVPWLKGDVNVELLRRLNYLGGALLLSSELASVVVCTDDPLLSVYGAALRLSAKLASRESLVYLPKVLYEDTTLADGVAAAEQQCVQRWLLEQGTQAEVAMSAIVGARSIRYSTSRHVSLVIPAWFPHGYLVASINSCLRFAGHLIAEIVVVTPETHAVRLVDWLGEQIEEPRLRVLSVSGGRAHDRVRLWSAGIEAAEREHILLLDDDVELIDEQSVTQLVALLEDSDVLVASGRLLSSGSRQPVVTQGLPVFSSTAGLIGAWNGAAASVLEAGPFGLLQIARDVPAVLPGLVAIHKPRWSRVGGFDADSFPYAYALSDLCFRASQAGLRAVWNPDSSAFHHGGVSQRRLAAEYAAELNQAAVQREHATLMSRWATGCRAWMLQSPHWARDGYAGLETIKVIEWAAGPRGVSEAPRVMTLPVHGGSADYRILEPLRAIESQGGCRLSVARGGRDRGVYLSGADVLLAQPDVVILQNSISDPLLAFLQEASKLDRSYRIVQTIDDLVDGVPEGHPNRRFSDREASVRVRQAIEWSDSLVVSTQPLADRYGRFAQKVRVVPNRLNRLIWGSVLDKPLHQFDGAAPRKPRVGWVGAQQHFDDLQMISPLVEELADQVDWIFMGMCPDALRRHVREYHGFVSFEKYPEVMWSLDLDLAIAPLVAHPFNECKSNLRLLEYGAMGWPVLCSDVYPYREGEAPVVRVPNELNRWKAAILELVHEASHARQMGAELKRWVERGYILQDHLGEWQRAYLEP